jgi:hypothetical protein
MALGIDDIPQRPSAAMGFRARDAPGGDASDFLSDSMVLGGDIVNESDASVRYGMLSRSAVGSFEDPMNGRNAGDLVSEADDLVSASEGDGGYADADSQDSILDDDESRVFDRSVLDRDELVTPMPPEKPVEGEAGELLELDEKGVADAMAAVAQLAEAVSFEDLMNAGGVQDPSTNSESASSFLLLTC